MYLKVTAKPWSLFTSEFVSKPCFFLRLLILDSRAVVTTARHLTVGIPTFATLMSSVEMISLITSLKWFFTLQPSES